MVELRAFQAVLPRVIELGADLVATSPDTPDESLSTATENKLLFRLLSDVGSAIANLVASPSKFPKNYDPFTLGSDIPCRT